MKDSYSKYGYMFIIPFFVVFIVFQVYPIFYTLYLSFTSYNGYMDPQLIGFENYTRVLNDNLFWESVVNTVKIWGLNIILQIGLSLGLVVIFSDLEYKVKGLGKFRTIFFLPNLIAAASVALLFSNILNTNYGALNTILYDLNIINKPIEWLESPFYAQTSVSLIQTWLWFGNTFILLMAGVQAIGKEYFEAAVIDGANRLQILRKITLPLIRPIFIYVAITSLIGGMQLFDIPLLLTDGYGSPEGSLQTIIIYLFNHAFKYNNFGYAAAISYVLFIILLIVSGLFMYNTTIKRVKEAK